MDTEVKRVLVMIRDGLAADLAGLNQAAAAQALRWARDQMQACIDDIDRALAREEAGDGPDA